MMHKTEHILKEIEWLERLDACAAARYYLTRELNRREASKGNPGASVRFNDSRHVADRERKAAKRETMK